eukprot:COSAG02_NODE_2358_length_9064_cov_12.658003_3_plen_973_part_00
MAHSKMDGVEPTQPATSRAQIEGWSVRQVCEWATAIGLPSQPCVTNLRKELVDGAALLELSADEIQHELGFPLGARKLLLRHLATVSTGLAPPASLQELCARNSLTVEMLAAPSCTETHVQRLLDESCATAAATIRILYELQAAKGTSSVDIADAVFADLEGQSVDDPDLEPEPASAAKSSPAAAGVFVFKASGAEPASAPASAWARPPAPAPAPAPAPVQSRPVFSDFTRFPTRREEWTSVHSDADESESDNELEHSESVDESESESGDGIGVDIDAHRLCAQGFAPACLQSRNLETFMGWLIGKRARSLRGSFLPPDLKRQQAGSCREDGFWSRGEQEANATGVDKEALHWRPGGILESDFDCHSPGACPRPSSEFMLRAVWKELAAAGEQILWSIGEQLGDPDMFDDYHMWEASVLSMFDYKARDPMAAASAKAAEAQATRLLEEAHKDRGLLTLIVSVASPSESLQVLPTGGGHGEGDWRDADARFNERAEGIEVMVLLGHTLEVATAGKLKACIHRVRCSSTPGCASRRQSLVFKLRADDDVMVTGDLTCAELMAKFDGQHRSINQNYTKTNGSSSSSSSPPITPVKDTIEAQASSEVAEPNLRRPAAECDDCFRRSALPEWRSPFLFCSPVCWQLWRHRAQPTEPELEPEPELDPEHEELPDEVFACIFSHLDAPTDLFRARRVCRQWRDAAASAIAWSHPRLGLGIAPWIHGVVRRQVLEFERETRARLLTSAQSTMWRRQLISTFKAWEAAVWEPLDESRDLLEDNSNRGRFDMQAIRETRQTRCNYGGSWTLASKWKVASAMKERWADDALARLMRQIEDAPSLSTLNLTDTNVTLHGLESAYEACRSDLLRKVVVAKCWGLQGSEGWAALRTRIENHGVCVQIDFIVSVKVRGQDGTEVFFKVRSHSPLKKLMEVYAQRQHGTPSAYRFIFDGNRIVETQRPIDLEMDDNDVIDAMLEQVGD